MDSRLFSSVLFKWFYRLLSHFQVFDNVILTSEKDANLDNRLNILRVEITLAVYTIISRGLFERHKLVFSFMLCIAILQQEGKISDAQWSFLLRGPVGSKSAAKKPDVVAVTDAMWQAANYLAVSYPQFQSLPEELTKAIPVQIGSYSLVKIYKITKLKNFHSETQL